MTLSYAIKERKVKEVRKLTKNLPSPKIADILESLAPKDRLVFFRLLSPDVQSDVFSSLEDDYQEALVKLFTDEQMKEVFQELYASEIADLIEEVPKPIAKRILKNTPHTMVTDVKKLLRYSDDEVGSIMTLEIITLKASQTIGEALKIIKNKHKDVYIDKYIFVTKRKGTLAGFVTIDDLMFLKNNIKLSQVVKPCQHVTTTMEVEKAIHVFADSDMTALPVLKSNKTIAGILSAEDVLDQAIEEADEDMQKMAGVVYDDTPYSRKSLWNMFKSRFIWLLLLMVSSTVSQIVLDSFQGFSQNALDHGHGGSGVIVPVLTTAIVAILPVISGAAGNAGSQASTMVIRALATNDISTKDYLRVFWKEAKVAFLIGFTLGAANFLRLTIYYACTGDLIHHTERFLFLSLAASVALWVVIMLAKVVGGLLPLIAKKLKMDPAVMAAPLLTTLIDALSTMIFFGISIGIMVMII